MLIDGLVAAVVSPINEDGTVNAIAVQQLTDRLINQNVKGVFVAGTTGEGPSLTIQQRKMLAEAFVQAASGKILVLIHVGHNSVLDMMSLAEHAQEIKADAIAACPPQYFGISTPEQLIDSLKPAASAAPELPFYYYHIPSLTGVDVSMPEFLHLAKPGIPTLRGIKFTSRDLDALHFCINRYQDQYQMLYGFDEMNIYALTAGCKAMVGSTYNLIAAIYYEIRAEFEAGEMVKARLLQQEANDIISVLLQFPLIPTIRFCLSELGINTGKCLLPLGMLSSEQQQIVRSNLAKTSYHKWATG